MTPLHRGRLYIGIGRTHARTHVAMLIADLDIGVIDTTTGELLHHLTLNYQPTGRPPGPPAKNNKGRTR